MKKIFLLASVASFLFTSGVFCSHSENTDRLSAEVANLSKWLSENGEGRMNSKFPEDNVVCAKTIGRLISKQQKLAVEKRRYAEHLKEMNVLFYVVGDWEIDQKALIEECALAMKKYVSLFPSYLAGRLNFESVEKPFGPICASRNLDILMLEAPDRFKKKNQEEK